MTIQEAYEKVKQLPNNNFLIECLDLGDSWGFGFSQKPYDENDSNTWVGGAYDTVNKQTGEIGAFNPFHDFEKADSAIEIPIEQFQ